MPNLQLRDASRYQKVYVCFIDFKKAFDKMRHNQLVEVLRRKSLDSRDIRILSNCPLTRKQPYEYKESSLTVESRQGKGRCMLSSILCNIYSVYTLSYLLKAYMTYRNC